MKKIIIVALILSFSSCATTKQNLDHSGWVIENRIEQKTEPGETILYKYYLQPTNGLSRYTWFVSPFFLPIKHVIPFR